MPLGHVVFAEETINTTDEDIEPNENVQDVIKSISEHYKDYLDEENNIEEINEPQDGDFEYKDDDTEEEAEEEKQGFLKKWFL